jgi:hypothetical protein
MCTRRLAQAQALTSTGALTPRRRRQTLRLHGRLHLRR